MVDVSLTGTVSRMRDLVWSGAAMLLAVSACSSSADVFPDRSQWPLVVEEIDCLDFITEEAQDVAGACMTGFVVGGLVYSVGCGSPPREGIVGEATVAVGRVDGVPVEVRELEGIRPDLLVATDYGAFLCDVSGWSIGMVHASSGAREALCEALADPSSAAGC